MTYYDKFCFLAYGGDAVIKKYIGLPMTLFGFLTIKQLLFHDPIQWKDNIGISIFTFLALVFWEWVGKPNKNYE